MTSRATSCYSDAILLEFNTGRLTDDTLEMKVAEHLSWCSRCDERLSSLPEDSIIALLKTPAPADSRSASDRFRFDLSLEPTRSRRSSGAAGNDEPTQARASSTATAPLPVRIDRYFVVKQLGNGGFAEVFLAKDSDHDRLVALKTPRRDRLSTRELRESFLREARTIAVLDHPHIVPLYDCRELLDGRCIVVMKYVDGETLREALRLRQFTARDVAKLVADIADALDYAHRQGIRHRDVKPGNILLDRQGHAFLADFGLAIDQQQQAWNSSEAAGTYPYMSPEELIGDGALVDHRSDLWSLGVVLYECLAKRRPFPGNKAEEVIAEVERGAPTPLADVDPEIPAALARICERCLRRTPAERFESAAELANALRDWLGRPSRRATLARGLGALAAVGVGALLSGAALLGSNERRSTLATWIGLAPPADPIDVAGDKAVSGDDDLDEGWRPVLAAPPVEAAWLNMQDNEFSHDNQAQRLIAQQHFGRGLLSCGSLPSSTFQLRYVIELTAWRGAAGSFWSLRDDLKSFPERRRQTLAVLLKRNAEQPQVLDVALQVLALTPSPFDTRKFECAHSHEYGEGKLPLPESSKLAVELHVERGQLKSLLVNGVQVTLQAHAIDLGWAERAPGEFGFVALDSRIVVDRAAYRVGAAVAR